jgi:hypothetical protein
MPIDRFLRPYRPVKLLHRWGKIFECAVCRRIDRWQDNFTAKLPQEEAIWSPCAKTSSDLPKLNRTQYCNL